jgi:HEAT repeat protein
MQKTFYVTGVCAVGAALTLLGGSARAASGQRVHSDGVLAVGIAVDPADSLFRSGRAAITDGDYKRAAAIFKQVGEKFPNSALVGDAMYWRAWALYKFGSSNRTKRDLDDAMVALDRYTSTYAKGSKLASDATDLRVRIRSAQASLGDADAAGDIAEDATKLRRQAPCTGSKVDEETRMAALDGLLSMSSEDAVPILTAVLKQRDACRVELRKKAVFLLTQKRSDGIVPALLDVARNDPSTDVRGDAIFWLSQARSDLAVPALDSILFAPSANVELRKKAIFALSQQRDDRARSALRRAAEDEKMPDEIRGDAVFQLGNAKLADLSYFRTLFRTTKSVELRKKVLFSVSQSSAPEASAWLLDVAKDKAFDTETRKDAIFWASQHRSVDLNQLEAIYNQAKGDDEVQKQVLFVYSQRREPAAVDKLMAIAKSDPDIELRKQALFWLGQKNDPRVKAFIRELINR